MLGSDIYINLLEISTNNIDKNVDNMLYWHTYVAINVDNKRKLFCKYFIHPYRKSTDIRRQHNIYIYIYLTKTIGIGKAVNCYN
jgi:hypothetical protein